MRKLLLALAVLLAPSVLFAQTAISPAWIPAQCAGDYLLEAVALNAGASSLTFYVGPKTPSCQGISGKPVEIYDRLLLEVYFDYGATAGTITMTCTVGQTQATAIYSPTTCTMSSGTCTINMSGVAVTASLSADTYWQDLRGTLGNPVVKCVVAHGGAPGATDKISVKGYLRTY